MAAVYYFRLERALLDASISAGSSHQFAIIANYSDGLLPPCFVQTRNKSAGPYTHGGPHIGEQRAQKCVCVVEPADHKHRLRMGNSIPVRLRHLVCSEPQYVQRKTGMAALWSPRDFIVFQE